MRRLVLAVVLAGCSSSPGGSATPDGALASGDAAADAASDGSAPPAFAWPTCGATAFDRNNLFYGHALAVAGDGTVLHAMYDGGEEYISRYRPGQPAEPTWIDVGTGGTGVGAIAIDPAGTPYALIEDGNDHSQLVSLAGGSVHPIGAPLTATSGPTALAFSADGILFEASFTGLRRVDLATGTRTPVSAALMLREVYFVGPRTARGVTYDHGLVEIALDAGATSSTWKTIFPFDTLALQFTGADQAGRTYAIIHEMSADKLIRFDPTFATRETLVSYPTVSGAFGNLAFGRGALRCDVLVSGFSIAEVVANDTPALP